MENSIEEDIKNIEEIIELSKEEIAAKNENITAILDITDLISLKHILSDYKRVLKENEEFKEYNMEYKRILDLADNRIYRKKYLEERRKEEPDLLYPDADEIYRRYYELRKENEEIKADNYELNNRITDLLENIPVQKIKDKIEELDERIKNPGKNSYWASYTISECIGIRRILQELLESENK